MAVGPGGALGVGGVVSTPEASDLGPVGKAKRDDLWLLEEASSPCSASLLSSEDMRDWFWNSDLRLGAAEGSGGRSSDAWLSRLVLGRSFRCRAACLSCSSRSSTNSL